MKDEIAVEFKSCINYMLTVAQHEVFQHLATMLEVYDITPGQYGILNYLWENQHGTPKELAQALALETSTISGVLDRMQKKGLIDRQIAPNDRRSILVVPTQEGEAIKDGVLEIVEELNREVLKDISPEEKDTLFSCLRRIGHIE